MKKTFVYQAILVSLLAHAAVLAVLNFVYVGGSDGESVNYSDEELSLDFVELQETLEMLEGLDQMPAEDVKSLIADANSERTSEEVSYKSKEAIAQEVYENLKDFEKQVMDELAEQHSEATYEGEIPEVEQLDNYDYMEKSYEGLVSATFDLDSRYPLEEPIPTYKCKSSGTVTVNITVNQQGDVVMADVNPSRTTTSSECLISEAQIYAKRWKFDSSFSHPKKQQGTIVFAFQAQ